MESDARPARIADMHGMSTGKDGAARAAVHSRDAKPFQIDVAVDVRATLADHWANGNTFFTE